MCDWILTFYIRDTSFSSFGTKPRQRRYYIKLEKKQTRQLSSRCIYC